MNPRVLESWSLSTYLPSLGARFGIVGIPHTKLSNTAFPSWFVGPCSRRSRLERIFFREREKDGKPIGDRATFSDGFGEWNQPAIDEGIRLGNGSELLGGNWVELGGNWDSDQQLPEDRTF